jgi:hypothetical protein
MNRNAALLGGLVLCGCGAWSQQEDPKIVVNVEGFRYPQLARSAIIQGDVLFEVSASGPRLVSGHPILVPAAQRNLETWTLPLLDTRRYLVSYHFVLLRESRRVAVPIGDKLDRLFLRVFHAPTENVHTVEVCDFEAATSMRQTIVKDGDDFVIDVFATSRPACASAD